MFYCLAGRIWLPSFCMCTLITLEGYHAPGLTLQRNRVVCPQKAAGISAERLFSNIYFSNIYFFVEKPFPSLFYVLFHMPSSSILVSTRKASALITSKLKTTVLPYQREVIAQQFYSHRATITRKTHLNLFTLKCWQCLHGYFYASRKFSLQKIKSQEYGSQKSSCYSITSDNSYHNFLPPVSSLTLSFVRRGIIQVLGKKKTKPQTTNTDFQHQLWSSGTQSK